MPARIWRMLYERKSMFVVEWTCLHETVTLLVNDGANDIIY